MQELFTVANLFNGMVLVVLWAIKNELCHIRESIAEAKTHATRAHERLDTFFSK